MAQIKQTRNFTRSLFPEATNFSRGELMNPVFDTDLSFKDPDEPEFKAFATKKQVGTGKKVKWFDRHLEGGWAPPQIGLVKPEMKSEGLPAIKKPINVKKVAKELAERIPLISLEETDAAEEELNGLLPSEMLIYNLMKGK